MKQETKPRRSLSAAIDAVIASSDDVNVAGMTSAPQQQPIMQQPMQQVGGEVDVINPGGNNGNATKPVDGIAGQETIEPAPAILTKKATTIMPKEVFNKLQMYCTQTDTPKHRALYFFIIDGLRKAEQITEEEYEHFKDLAVQLTTTYEKK